MTADTVEITRGWGSCPSCARVRRTTDDIMVEHWAYDGQLRVMVPCPGQR